MVVFSIVNNAQRAIIGVAAVFMVLPIVAVTLRIYGRHLKGVGLDLSDYLIMGGLVSFCFSGLWLMLTVFRCAPLASVQLIYPVSALCNG